MPYQIGDDTFASKEEILNRCRRTIAATPDGADVVEHELPFLFELLSSHDEWHDKSQGGVRSLTARTTTHGTRCFMLVKHDGSEVDISFPHAVRLLPTRRTGNLVPQRLRDFRGAARATIQPFVRQFRDCELALRPYCVISGEPLSRQNCAVDHSPPATFDQLLFDFCVAGRIDPLIVSVGSRDGTEAFFQDEPLAQDWYRYHEDRAALRLVSRLANLRLPRASVDWNELWEL